MILQVFFFVLIDQVILTHVFNFGFFFYEFLKIATILTKFKKILQLPYKLIFQLFLFITPVFPDGGNMKISKVTPRF